MALAGIGVDDRHQLIVTGGVKSPLLLIQSQAGSILTRVQRPSRLYAKGFYVDPYDLALVVDVDVDVALASLTGDSEIPSSLMFASILSEEARITVIERLGLCSTKKLPRAAMDEIATCRADG